MASLWWHYKNSCWICYGDRLGVDCQVGCPYYQPNVEPSAPANSNPPERSSLEEMMAQLIETTNKFIETTTQALSDTQAQLQTHGLAIRNLEVQMGQIESMLDERLQENLPIMTEENPREITLSLEELSHEEIELDDPIEISDEPYVQREEASLSVALSVQLPQVNDSYFSVKEIQPLVFILPPLIQDEYVEIFPLMEREPHVDAHARVCRESVAEWHDEMSTFPFDTGWMLLESKEDDGSQTAEEEWDGEVDTFPWNPG